MKIFLTLFLILIGSMSAEDKKLELGIGTGSLYFPAYKGSKSTQTYTVPFPYIKYKSEYFNIDKEGIRGKLFDIKDLELDISLAGSLPADSDNTKAREGMPNLDLTFEVGPKIIYKLFEGGVAKLHIELPIRAVFATDFKKIRSQGMIMTPQIKYALEYEHLEITLRTGPVFADEQYHSYFYDVEPRYATATREAYDAKGGFNSYKNSISITYKKNNWWGGAFFSHYDLSSAVYKDSPLIETHSAIYGGFALAYIFYTDN